MLNKIITSSKFGSILTLAFFLIVMIITGYSLSIFENRDNLQTLISNSGSLGIIIYIIIQILYVTFTPLLNTGILISSGFLFGGHLGFLINFIATSLGLILIILLVKRFGRPLLEKLVSQKYLNKFDYLTEKIGPLTLLIVYILPFTPDDELTYIIAAGPNKIWRFILPLIIGTLAKSAYSYIGDLGNPGLTIALYARGAGLVVGLSVVGAQEYLVSRYNRVSKKKAIE